MTPGLSVRRGPYAKCVVDAPSDEKRTKPSWRPHRCPCAPRQPSAPPDTQARTARARGAGRTAGCSSPPRESRSRAPPSPTAARATCRCRPGRTGFAVPADRGGSRYGVTIGISYTIPLKGPGPLRLSHHRQNPMFASARDDGRQMNSSGSTSNRPLMRNPFVSGDQCRSGTGAAKTFSRVAGP